MKDGIDQNELYISLSPAVRDELAKYEEQARVPAGTTLISQNEVPEHLIVIQRGSVEISVPAGQKTLFLSVAGEGKILGLRSILANVLPDVQATALEQCSILRIPRQSFLEVLERNPEIYFAISKVLSTDLNVAERFLRETLREAGKEKNRTSNGVAC